MATDRTLKPVIFDFLIPDDCTGGGMGSNHLGVTEQSSILNDGDKPVLMNDMINFFPFYNSHYGKDDTVYNMKIK